jgi:exonuclease VII large subunit
LDDALSQRIRKQLQGEIDIELAAKKDQLRQHELRLQQEKAGLEEQQKNLEAEMARRIADEKARLKPRIQKELEEKRPWNCVS